MQLIILSIVAPLGYLQMAEYSSINASFYLSCEMIDNLQKVLWKSMCVLKENVLKYNAQENEYY